MTKSVTRSRGDDTDGALRLYLQTVTRLLTNTAQLHRTAEKSGGILNVSAPLPCARLAAPASDKQASIMATILMPLPDQGFDVTEVAVPWRHLTDAGHDVIMATEHGGVPNADPLLITGVVFGRLGAEPEPIAFYREFEPRSNSR